MPATIVPPPAALPTSASPTPAQTTPTHDPADYDWVPVRRRSRADGWTIARQRAFIGYLADTGSVRQAAQEAGVSPSSAYRLRRAPDGAAFAAAWDAAIQQAAYALVDAAFERAVHGSEEPVWDKHGNVIGRRFRQSDAMMMFLLRKHFPARYGDIHRDRPGDAAPAPAAPPVAASLDDLGPPPPADPAALLAAEDAADLYDRADGGASPGEHRAPTDAEWDAANAGRVPDFDAWQAAANGAADDPDGSLDDAWSGEDDDDPDDG